MLAVLSERGVESGRRRESPVTGVAGQAAPITGLALLLLIRKGEASDLAGLCRAVGIDPDDYTAMYVSAKLDQLEREGLIEETDDGRYRLTDRWAKIQAALNLSLTAAAALTPGTVVVRPYFGVPNVTATPRDVF